MILRLLLTNGEGDTMGQVPNTMGREYVLSLVLGTRLLSVS